MSELLPRLNEKAEAFVLFHFPEARREGNSLLVAESARVIVVGIAAGRLKREGQPDGDLLDALAMAFPKLNRAGLEAKATQWINNNPNGEELEEESAPVSRERGEPAEITARSITQPAHVNGTDIHQRVSYLPDIHRLLPQSPDAEQGVLSSFLLAPKEIGALCRSKGIYAGHFHLPHHRTLFEWMQQLYDDNEPIDFITLTKKLRDANQLDQVGGAAFVTHLFTYLPTAANAAYYVEILEEKYALREGIKVYTQYAARCYDEQDDVWNLLGEASKQATNIAELANGHAITRLPRLQCAAQWADEKALAPEPPQIIGGMLHRGSKLVIGGTSKGRKTFTLIDLAVSVAAGVPWWGAKTHQGRVCYLNFELQDFAMQRRVRWICDAKKVPIPEDLHVMTLRGWTDPIENLAPKLIDYFRTLPPFALIILDPIYKLLNGRNENGVGEVTELLNHIERIGVETGAATAFGHHFSKGNQAAKESIDRLGGSGAFARDPDAILTMTAHEQDDSFTVDATLRNFAPVAPFVVKWEMPLFVRDETADPTQLKQPKVPGKPFEQSYTHEMILGELSVLDGMVPAHLKSKVCNETGMTRSTFFRFIAELNKAGKIEKRVDGKWYRKGRVL